MTIQPNGTSGTITGTAWKRVRTWTTWASAEQIITDVYKGPYSQLSTAYAWLFSNVLARSITPNVSDGSAVASINVVKAPTTWSWGAAGEQPIPGEVREPMYEVYPVTQSLDIRTMFLISGVSPKEIETIDKAIRDGTCADLDVTGYLSATQQYRIWRMHGVEQFERTSYNLRIQRFFGNVTKLPIALTTDYGNTQNVFAWASILTLGNAVPSFVKEPKTTGRWSGAQETYTAIFSSQAQSYKLNSVGVQYQGKWISVVWDFQGAHAWGSDFYSGGTWTPTL